MARNGMHACAVPGTSGLAASGGACMRILKEHYEVTCVPVAGADLRGGSREGHLLRGRGGHHQGIALSAGFFRTQGNT